MPNSKVRKVLIITYYWPPAGGAGVQRWLKFVKYLRLFNWEPIVYTPENPQMPAIDETLEKDIPSGIEIIKLPIKEPYNAYKKLVGLKKEDKLGGGFIQDKKKLGFTHHMAVWLRGNFFIPDARKFWIKPSIRFLEEYISHNPVVAVIYTGPPHSMHLIAQQVHHKTHIPWLADFRDPWTGIDFYHQLKLTKIADSIHHTLEKKVLQQANEVVVVSNRMKEEFYNIHKREYHVITNGFDEDDIKPLPYEELDKKFTLTHTGSLTASRNPEALWEAIGEAVNQHPALAKALEIKLIGKNDVSVIQSIKNNNLLSYLIQSEYIPHPEVIKAMQKSQVLLLLINNTPNAKGILTGKLFEYLATGRPILNIGPTDCDAALVITQCNAGSTIDLDDKENIKKEILSYFSLYEKGLHGGKHDIDKTYSRKNLTSQIAVVLNKMAE